MSEVSYVQRLEIDLGQPAAAVGELASGLERLARAEDDLRRPGRSLGSSGPRSLAEPRFLSGPSQRLLQIADQRGRLGSISDPDRRAAVAADLDRAEQNARRSIQSGGLLNLVGQSNALLRGLGSGGGGERPCSAGSRRDWGPAPGSCWPSPAPWGMGYRPFAAFPPRRRFPAARAGRRRSPRAWGSRLHSLPARREHSADASPPTLSP